MEWKDKVNGVDICLAEDINSIAHGVISNEEKIDQAQTDLQSQANELKNKVDKRAGFGVCYVGDNTDSTGRKSRVITIDRFNGTTTYTDSTMFYNTDQADEQMEKKLEPVETAINNVENKLDNKVDKLVEYGLCNIIDEEDVTKIHAVTDETSKTVTFYNKTQTDNLLEEKVDKVDGFGLFKMRSDNSNSNLHFFDKTSGDGLVETYSEGFYDQQGTDKRIEQLAKPDSKVDKASGYGLARIEGVSDNHIPTNYKIYVYESGNGSTDVSFYSTEQVDKKIEPINTQLQELENTSITRYGVKFGGGANSGETVQRLYNAVGLVANVGTDTETATNDFDSIYPWSERKRCCGYWDEDGAFVINAYEGDDGYTTDGSNGEVWVETPLFYYKHTYGDDGSEEIVISAYPIGGFSPSPIHINKDGSLSQKAYTAAYPMAVVDDKPTSRSGVYTPYMSLDAGMSNARLLGEKYTTTTTAEQYTKCLLMWVEFATRDIQTKMKGCCSLAYRADHTATVAENSTNRIIIASKHSSYYVIGQGIGIGTSLGNTNIAGDRTVTAINAYDDDNIAISFDGDPIDIAVGNIVFAIAWKTGSCDNVLSSSGSPVSNTSGKYTCIYRGEETPFANAFECISDLLFKREGSGTTQDPYTYGIYFLKDPTKYSSGTITSNYIKLNFNLPQIEGYVKKLGFDRRFPWLRIPCEVGADATTYYSDYYYRPNYEITAPAIGGLWNYDTACGLYCWNCGYVSSLANIFRRARLSYHR